MNEAASVPLDGEDHVAPIPAKMATTDCSVNNAVNV